MIDWGLNKLTLLDKLILTSHLGYNTEPLTYKEISVLTDLTVAMVKTHIAYASRKMRMLIKIYEPSIESDLGLKKRFKYDSSHLIDKLPNNNINTLVGGVFENDEDIIQEEPINDEKVKKLSIISIFKKIFNLKNILK